MKTPAARQIEILSEGLVDFISEKEFHTRLEEAIKKKKPLRVKYGADPSAPDLHLGHTVPLRKLRQFQELGHLVVFIVGDFTAQIGDPSERSETRRMLTPEEVKKNAKTYQDQVFRILIKDKTEVRYNSEWLGKMTPRDFLTLTSQYTVARLIERDDFKKRFEANRPISLTEFLYPLLQGYDSVKIESDVEIGGTDQKFNLLVGRELQKSWHMPSQIVMTLPLIEGTDGMQKMSKSLGNDIGIQAAPGEMFGKIMSIPDSLMDRYFRYVSGFPIQEVKEILDHLKSETLHPREAKARLAEQIVAMYHSPEEAQRAKKEFDLVFKSKGIPEEMPFIRLSHPKMDLVSLLKEAKLVASKSEGRRLIEQGAVKLNQERVSDPQKQIDLKDPVLIQCGKRQFAKVQHGKS